MKFAELSVAQREKWDKANAEAKKAMVDMLDLTEVPEDGKVNLGALAQFNTGGDSSYGERTSKISFGTGKITSGDYVLGVGNGKVGYIKRTALETLTAGVATGKNKLLKIVVDPDGQTHLVATGTETFSMYTPVATDGKSRLVFGPNMFMPQITVKGSFVDEPPTV